MAKIKRLAIQVSVSWGGGAKEIPCTAGRNVVLFNNFGKQVNIMLSS